jgi:uncharacterized protein
VSGVFLDTSAVLALLNPKDESHERAILDFESLQRRRARLVTTSYVLVESYALLGRRMGLTAVRAFRESLAPLCETVWVDQEIHDAALDLLLERGRRDLSLVDAVSLVVMNRQTIESAFAFDRHLTA